MKKEIGQNLIKISFLVTTISLFLLLPGIYWWQKNHSLAQEPTILSPLPTSGNVANYHESKQNLYYYITSSQEFLNKARHLANSNQNQTPEDKEKVIKTINAALELINQATVFYPQDARGFAQRAKIYQALASFWPEAHQQAIRDWTEAINLNNQNPEYHRQLAQLYSETGNFQKAAFSFYQTHCLIPTEVQVILDLASSLEKAGEIEKSLQYWEKLLALLPPDDQNLKTIQKKKESLRALLEQAQGQYLSPAGKSLPTTVDKNYQPQESTKEEKILGIQELPTEQAFLTPKIVIAESNGKSMNQETSQIETNAKSGRATLPAGKTEVIIENKNITTKSVIIINPTTGTNNQVLAVLAKKATTEQTLGWVKVGIDKALDFNLEFDWWVIENETSPS